jgi:hypothetical protein
VNANGNVLGIEWPAVRMHIVGIDVVVHGGKADVVIVSSCFLVV